MNQVTKKRTQSFRRKLKTIENLFTIMHGEQSPEVSEMIQQMIIENLQKLEQNVFSFSPPTNDYSYERK